MYYYVKQFKRITLLAIQTSQVLDYGEIEWYCSINPLNAKPTKWSNTLNQFFSITEKVIKMSRKHNKLENLT